MTAKKPFSIATILLSILLIASLLNVQVAFADGETPTEPPAPTQVETEPPPPSELPVELPPPTESSVESMSEVVVATPVTDEAISAEVMLTTEILDTTATQETSTNEDTPITGILSDIPEDTNVVALDEEGLPLVLGSQEAADAAVTSDPVWCPASVSAPTPGANGCSISYASITALLEDMRKYPASFSEDGTIFLEKPGGQGFTTPLILNDSATSLASSFATLSIFDLTIRGGWNKDNPGTFSGQTDFGASGGNQGYILIGSAANPWAGNIILSDLHISNTSLANAVTVYTTTGNITLDNVDVDQQTGGKYTGYLESNSGNINVDASYFNGSNQGANSNRGFYAKTNTGSISITGNGAYTFQDAIGTGSVNYNGATLSAPTVTLTNVLSQDNDGNGIEIQNASFVTLDNVTSGPNVNNQGNGLSGVLINGTGSPVVNVTGGVFAGNLRYGIEILNGSLFVHTAPTCPATNGMGCYNIAPITDSTAPVIAPTLTGTAGLNGWYKSDVLVTWSVTDAESGILSSIGCTDSNLTAGGTLTCSATNKMGLSNSASVTVNIDKAAPILSLPSDITTQVSGPTAVTYSVSATDNLDPTANVTCSPVSGSTFALGTTVVNCSSTDAAGNTASDSFQVTLKSPNVVIIPNLPQPVPTDSQFESSISVSDSQRSIIPLTSAEKIHLDCDSVFWSFGVKFSFVKLCDYQTTVNSIGSDNLPGKLPDGFTFVMGLNMSLFKGNQTIQDWPDGASVQMDFPTAGEAKGQFVVLYWDGSEWIEVSQQDENNENSQMLSIMTDKIGTFILVKK